MHCAKYTLLQNMMTFTFFPKKRDFDPIMDITFGRRNRMARKYHICSNSRRVIEPRQFSPLMATFVADGMAWTQWSHPPLDPY